MKKLSSNSLANSKIEREGNFSNLAHSIKAEIKYEEF